MKQSEKQKAFNFLKSEFQEDSVIRKGLLHMFNHDFDQGETLINENVKSGNISSQELFLSKIYLAILKKNDLLENLIFIRTNFEKFISMSYSSKVVNSVILLLFEKINFGLSSYTNDLVKIDEARFKHQEKQSDLVRNLVGGLVLMENTELMLPKKLGSKMATSSLKEITKDDINKLDFDRLISILDESKLSYAVTSIQLIQKMKDQYSGREFLDEYKEKLNDFLVHINKIWKIEKIKFDTVIDEFNSVSFPNSDWANTVFDESSERSTKLKSEIMKLEKIANILRFRKLELKTQLNDFMNNLYDIPRSVDIEEHKRQVNRHNLFFAPGGLLLGLGIFVMILFMIYVFANKVFTFNISDKLAYIFRLFIEGALWSIVIGIVLMIIASFLKSPAQKKIRQLFKSLKKSLDSSVFEIETMKDFLTVKEIDSAELRPITREFQKFALKIYL